MSRILKFRAWDEERKKFFTSPKWVEFQVNVDGELSAKNIKPPFAGKGYQNLDIMQYIEENDKNNTEIYDGDIVLIPSGYSGDNHYEEAIGVIVYGADFALSKNMSDYNYDEVTVIGNIYERPDLIKDVDFGMFNDYKENLFSEEIWDGYYHQTNP